MKERDIEQYLVSRVKELGGEVRKVKWIGRRGAPDRLVMLPASDLVAPGVVGDQPKCGFNKPVSVLCLDESFEYRGRTLWVELKAPGEKPEPHQLREHVRMRRMGQLVVVVDSIERVDEVLR